MSDEMNVVTANQGVVEVVSSNPTVTMSPISAGKLESHGLVVGDIGTKISRVPIEKYKASTTKTDRIGFVSKQVIGVKSHYIEDNGSVLCFGKKCCEVLGLPQVRYLFPIVIYSTDNEGTIVGKKIEIKILTAGEDLYKSIITISRGLATQGGIDNADMLVTCTDDKFQKITLSPIGPAAWKKSGTIVQMVNDRWAADAEYAYMALARKVDEATFLKLVGMDESTSSTTGLNSSAPGGSFNAAVNQDISKFFED
jgi:hypothetical protein